ncbi:MAG: hypothetical protein IKC37_02640, partial [Clostridia bacterium]|nr:hypothetical protein [Clostridia bacterium]
MRRISIKPNVILCSIFGAFALLFGALIIMAYILVPMDVAYKVSETEREGTVVSIGVEESEEY